MNVNGPHRSYPDSPAAAARAHSSEVPPPLAEDSHLLELLRTLRSLAADSPERQAKIEGLMRAYANDTLRIDAEATASAMIDDAVFPRSTFP